MAFTIRIEDPGKIPSGINPKKELSELAAFVRLQYDQPIILDELMVEIAKVEGVQAVPSLTFNNKYQQRDGSDYATYTYNLEGNTKDRIVYPSADPCIFELRYPQTDIVGTAQQ